MTPQEIYQKIEPIKYGWIDIKDEKHFKLDPSLFFENYKSQTPIELIDSEVGICWDQVELERYYFKQTNLKFHSFDIIYDKKNSMPNHTFFTYEENSKHYWFEHAWDKYKGIHEYDSLKSLLNDIKDKFIVDELKNECDINSLSIFEYEEPKLRLTCMDYYNHFMNGKNVSSIIKE